MPITGEAPQVLVVPLEDLLVQQVLLGEREPQARLVYEVSLALHQILALQVNKV
jgi:hypothetical protein